MSGQIGPGGTITGDLIVQGQTDTIAVYLTAGYSTQFNVISNPTNVDPELTLLSPSGSTVVGRTGSSNGYGYISYTPGTSGTYDVQVIDGSGTGPYSLNESAQDDFPDTQQTPGTISPGGTIAGVLGAVGDSDWFAATLAAGFSYEFEVSSNPTTGIDPEISLLSSTGATVISPAYSSNGFVDISYTPGTSGVFDVDVTGLGTALGPYSLIESPQDDYTDNQQTTGTLTVNGTTAGALQAIGDVDWIATSLTAGRTYQFTVSSNSATGIDPEIGLYSPTGSTAVNYAYSSNGFASISYTVGTSGTYDVAVTGYGTVTGAYSVVEKASGAVTVDAGSGSTTYTIPTDDNYDVTSEGANTIVAASGSPTVVASLGNPLVYGNAASLTFVGGSGAATVVGGSGANAIRGGSGSLVLFAVGTTSFTAGTGSASIVGGSSPLTAALGTGGGVIFGAAVGGNVLSSAATAGLNGLIGGGAGDVLSASGAGEEILVAGSGAETLNAAGNTGAAALYGGTGFDVLRAGSGVTYFIPGSASETLTAGSGSDAFLFTPGAAARIDTIFNFNTGQDEVGLLGYGANAASAALAGATLSGGSTSITLSDNTTIIFSGVTHLTSSNLIST